jgi:hypothetical protein
MVAIRCTQTGKHCAAMLFVRPLPSADHIASCRRCCAPHRVPGCLSWACAINNGSISSVHSYSRNEQRPKRKQPSSRDRLRCLMAISISVIAFPAIQPLPPMLLPLIRQRISSFSMSTSIQSSLMLRKAEAPMHSSTNWTASKH